MKKIIAISICIILLFTGCTRENNVKNNSSTVSLPSQTELTIKKLLDYIKENKDSVLEFYPSNHQLDNFQISFQNVYGNDNVELIVGLTGNTFSESYQNNRILIFTVKNNEVVYLGDYRNFIKNNKNKKTSLKKFNGEIYSISTSIEKQGYSELYKEDYYDYDKEALLPNDNLELSFTMIERIGKSSKFEYPGGAYCFQTIKSTSQQVFFYNVCPHVFYDEIEHLEDIWNSEGKDLYNNEKRLSEYFVKECENYKNPNTGLYELYTVEKDIIDKLWGEKDYFISFATRGCPEVMVLPKDDYEKLYAEYMNNFEDYNSKVYMSKELTLEDLDLDKIEKEAVAFFSEK